MRPSPFAAVLVLGTFLAIPAHAADKVKGFYAGSGGMSAADHRTLFIEFGADGTAILQQKWHDKDPQTWHARWKKTRSSITLTYEPAKDAAPTPEPLVFSFKHGALVPTSWDSPTLGIKPPTLTPFGGRNPQAGSVSQCQSLNTLDPTRDCVTWGTHQ
jgi:hypothetical protein